MSEQDQLERPSMRVSVSKSVLHQGEIRPAVFFTCVNMRKKPGLRHASASTRLLEKPDMELGIKHDAYALEPVHVKHVAHA